MFEFNDAGYMKTGAFTLYRIFLHMSNLFLQLVACRLKLVAPGRSHPGLFLTLPRIASKTNGPQIISRTRASVSGIPVTLVQQIMISHYATGEVDAVCFSQHSGIPYALTLL